MAKLFLAPPLIAAGCLVAGTYGAAHNQVSYTVSPEYFHAFKFHQFGVPHQLRNRFGASVVGWRASWWMGILTGIPLVLVGLIIPGWKAYVKSVLLSFAIAAVTAFALGFGALLFAIQSISAETLPPYYFPDDVGDRVAFARAGTMHNFSYLGGGIGVITGCVYLGVARVRMLKPKP